MDLALTLKRQVGNWMGIAPVPFDTSPQQLVDDELKQLQQTTPEQASLLPEIEKTLMYLLSSLRSHKKHDIGFVFIEHGTDHAHPVSYEGTYAVESDEVYSLRDRNGGYQYWRVDENVFLTFDSFSILGNTSIDGRGIFSVRFNGHGAHPWVASLRTAFTHLRRVYISMNIRRLLGRELAEKHRNNDFLVSPRAIFGQDRDGEPNWRNAASQLWMARNGLFLQPVNGMKQPIKKRV